MKTLRTSLIALATVATLNASSAQACGFIGCILDTVAPGVGTALDKLNERADLPFEHAVAVTANGLVPGTGTALETGWAIQRSGILNPPPRPQANFSSYPTYGGYVQPNYGYANYGYNNYGYNNYSYNPSYNGYSQPLYW